MYAKKKKTAGELTWYKILFFKFFYGKKTWCKVEENNNTT